MRGKRPKIFHRITLALRLLGAGLHVGAASPSSGQDKSVVLASTTSPQNSGLFGHILPMFKAETGHLVLAPFAGNYGDRHIFEIGCLGVARNRDNRNFARRLLESCCRFITAREKNIDPGTDEFQSQGVFLLDIRQVGTPRATSERAHLRRFRSSISERVQLGQFGEWATQGTRGSAIRNTLNRAAVPGCAHYGLRISRKSSPRSQRLSQQHGLQWQQPLNTRFFIRHAHQ
jgi:hypothetical protein